MMFHKNKTLFHVVKSQEILQSILLDSGFKASYCFENFEFRYYKTKGTIPYHYYIPMVSFTDIEKESILSQNCTYGNFAIGMNLEWAKEKGLNPVLYLEQHSKIAHSIKDLINKVKRADAGLNHLDEAITILLQSIKNYEGHYQEKDIKYYDEREWRYIPEFGDEYKKYVHVDDFVKFDKPHIKDDKYKLEFSEDAVDYIIVETIEQKEILLGCLESYGFKKISDKIISADNWKLNSP